MIVVVKRPPVSAFPRRLKPHWFESFCGAAEAAPFQSNGPSQNSDPFQDNGLDSLEVAPEGLIVDFVVVLDFGGFDEGAELARRAVGCCALEVGETALHVGTEDVGDP